MPDTAHDCTDTALDLHIPCSPGQSRARRTWEVESRSRSVAVPSSSVW